MNLLNNSFANELFIEIYYKPMKPQGLGTGIVVRRQVRRKRRENSEGAEFAEPRAADRTRP